MLELFPLPSLSDELQDLVDEFPHEFAVRTNGLTIEQRIYLIAQLFYETQPSPIPLAVRQATLKEAGDLLILWGQGVVLESDPRLASVFQATNHPEVREGLINVLMIWTPEWEVIINSLKGLSFCMGNNRWQILGYYAQPGVDDRSKVRAECLTVLPREGDRFESDAPVFPLGQRFAMGIQQIESGLNRRLV